MKDSADRPTSHEAERSESAGAEDPLKEGCMVLESQELGQIGSLLGALCGDDDVLGPSWLTSCPMSFTASKSPLAALARDRSVAFKRIGEEGRDTILSPACGPDETDMVSSLQWVEAELLDEEDDEDMDNNKQRGLHRNQGVALFVGCTSGAIRAYDLEGKLILSQTLHLAKVKAFRLRGYGSADRTQDLLVVFEDSVVARIDGATIITLLKTHQSRRRAQQLTHCKWKMQSQGGLADAVCCGLDEQVCEAVRSNEHSHPACERGTKAMQKLDTQEPLKFHSLPLARTWYGILFLAEGCACACRHKHQTFGELCITSF
jgi:hypothetical protein